MRPTVGAPPLARVLAAAALLAACSAEPTAIDPDLASRGSTGPLRLTPSSLRLSSPGLPGTFTATDRYAGVLTASSSNPRCATVSPASTRSAVNVAQFTVTPAGEGSCTIAVTDKKGNVAFAGIHVVLARIAYSPHPTVEDPNQIYLMDPDGQHRTQVTNGADGATTPAWSPDRARIAFTDQMEIYVMDADGQNRTRLTTNTWRDVSPDWSPDGGRIAFVSERDGNREIYLMDPDGQNPTRLTTNAGEDDFPAWSPDGSRIAFYSDRNGQPGIYVMDADGQHTTARLSAGTQPNWSPLGDRIAFSHQSRIYLIDPDGQHPTLLTSGPEDEKPSWSPDGRRIAWECTFIDEICVMDADGQYQAQITTNSNESNDLAWQ
jgi:Tol biopolymer transport system component